MKLHTKGEEADPEFKALAGHGCSALSHEAKLVYLLCIRPWMDYETGVAGHERTISYQQIREVLEYNPPRGSTKPKKRYEKEQIRAVLAELERSGLVRWIKNEDWGLYFECLLAPRGKRPEIMSNPRATLEQPHSDNPTENPMGNPTEARYSTGLNQNDKPDGKPKEQPGCVDATDNKSNPPPGVCLSVNAKPDNKNAPAPRNSTNQTLPQWVPVDLWAVWKGMWESQRKCGMPIGAELVAVQSLGGLRTEGHDPADVLRQAITGGWLNFKAPAGIGPAQTGPRTGRQPKPATRVSGHDDNKRAEFERRYGGRTPAQPNDPDGDIT